jgi:opacity protein-like surface antigen
MKLMLILALTLCLAMLPITAAAVVAPEQPYETGPVIHSDWLAPQAPYTGNQPYETGPVMHSDWMSL